jgi:hypothetical protein
MHSSTFTDDYIWRMEISLIVPDCNKVLLVYGLTNLAKMQEDSLDKMDPYQRGATDISKCCCI